MSLWYAIIDFHGLTVDTAKSISLLIPSSYFFSNSKNDDLAVLMFLDRDYGGVGEFARFAKKMLKDAKVVRSANDYFFVEKLGNRSIDYQLSFDPFAETLDSSEGYYFVQSIEPEAIDIPEIRTLNPKKSCEIWFIKDGVLFQMTAFGDFCSHESYDQILKSFESLLDRWRISGQ